MKKSCLKGCFCSKAFTLIELLVVVLIIGILAAVAVPQYRVAVAKSRYAKLKHLVRALVQAEETYYLANNDYTVRMEELDVDIPNGTLSAEESSSKEGIYDYEWGRCHLINSEEARRVVCIDNKINMDYREYLLHSLERPGQRRCVVRGDNIDETDWRNSICKTETHNDYEVHPSHIMVLWDYK